MHSDRKTGQKKMRRVKLEDKINNNTHMQLDQA